jgi:hypothetical protein
MMVSYYYLVVDNVDSADPKYVPHEGNVDADEGDDEPIDDLSAYLTYLY